MDYLEFLKLQQYKPNSTQLNKGLNYGDYLSSQQIKSSNAFNSSMNSKSLWDSTKPTTKGKGSIFNKWKGSGGKSGGFAGGIWGGIGQASDAVSGMIDDTEKDKTVAAADDVFNKASTAVMAINPVVGGLMKVGGLATDVLRKKGFTLKNPTNSMDKLTSSKLGSLLPVSLVNVATRKRIDGTSGVGETVNYGYNPTEEIADADVGGVTNWLSKKFKNKNLVTDQQKKVERADKTNALMSTNIYDNNRNLTAATNSAQNTVSKNMNQLYGRNNTRSVIAAKKGIKLSEIKRIKKDALEKIKVKEEVKVNVIPDGSLHARKHNLDMDGITHKGIPVVSLDEGGEVTQHAEIEKEEIIFHKDLTDKIEACHKKYKETDNDELLIKMGKLITFEILENTEDNVGLLED